MNAETREEILMKEIKGRDDIINSQETLIEELQHTIKSLEAYIKSRALR